MTKTKDVNRHLPLNGRGEYESHKQRLRSCAASRLKYNQLYLLMMGSSQIFKLLVKLQTKI